MFSKAHNLVSVTDLSNKCCLGVCVFFVFKCQVDVCRCV